MLKFNIKSILLLGLMVLFFAGCFEKDDGPNIHWDRDMCERCKMVVSERNFAVQVINPEDKKKYVFDDLGCAIVWFDQEKLDWLDKATIFINDATNGEWINAKQALYATGNLTPMGYGVSAYTEQSFPKGATKLTFEDAIKVINKKEHSGRAKHGHGHAGQHHE